MRRALLLSAALVLAGCGGAAWPGGDKTPTGATAGAPSSTPTATGAPTSTPAPTGTGARTASPTPAPRNPWRTGTVEVALAADGHDGVDYRAALADALAYWNDHGAFATYPVTFRLVGDTERAGIRVRITDSVGTCGYETGASIVGCAPLLTATDTVGEPVEVRIEAGYDRRSTRSVMIHEFGHVLGIRHGEPPREYMEAGEALRSVDRPDADERGWPWETASFAFYVDASNRSGDDRAAARDQVGHAVEYYRSIAGDHPGVPENVTIRRVENRTAANVVVVFPESNPCGDGSGSCLRWYGPDEDGDGTVEYYREVTVPVVGIETDAVGWHVGYWFGRALGMDDSGLPEPFRSASYRERRSWWR